MFSNRSGQNEPKINFDDECSIINSVHALYQYASGLWSVKDPQGVYQLLNKEN